MSTDPGRPGTHPAWICQHIGIAWVQHTYDGQKDPADRDGFKVLEHYEGREGLDYRLQHLTLPDGPTLRFIDSVCDTFFNSLQVSAFIEELREIRTRCTDADLAAGIDSIIEFASRTHEGDVQLWFIGD